MYINCYVHQPPPPPNLAIKRPDLTYAKGALALALVLALALALALAVTLYSPRFILRGSQISPKPIGTG